MSYHQGKFETVRKVQEYMESRVACASLLLVLLTGCNTKKDYVLKTMTVTVSAYNSTVAQTDGLPTLAAWSDTLVPGIKSVAVSRDLIALGLDHNTELEIKGLKGVYVVKDKMAARWKKRIDIYMGNDVAKAREWGVQERKIRFRVKKEADGKK